MKARVMVYHPDQPYKPIAVSDDAYELHGDGLDDDIACAEVIVEWKRAGSRATGDVSRAKEPGLLARCIREDQVRPLRKGDH